MVLFTGFILIVMCLIFWWRDVIREATFEGRHTLAVQRGLKLGFALFLVSEAMFFFSFFWAFFHSSLSPAVEIGGVWPPVGIQVVNPFGIPLMNTIFLLASGMYLTSAHYRLIAGLKFATIDGLQLTLFYAVCFMINQGIEYWFALFDMSDGIYGSCFFIMTGFHGLHVIIGTIFIIVATIRTKLSHFSREHHIGFETAAWYWHFVDIVWLALFLALYWWGSL